MPARTFASPTYWVIATFNFLYILIQPLIIWLFKPPPPPPPKPPEHWKPKIATIGAGMASVSSAAHAIAYGFDVKIFEQTTELGGIWTHVDKTSGLQPPSFLYRFHPGVDVRFPQTRQNFARYVDDISNSGKSRPGALVQKYAASGKSTSSDHVRASTPASPLSSALGEVARSKWVINNDMDEEFDAVVVAIGTCRAPQRVDIPGLSTANLEKDRADYEENNRDVKGSEDPGEAFEGEVLHSSELRRTPLKGKAILVIGSGASGLARGAKHCVIVAPNDKPSVGQQRFSFIWETIIKILNYRGAGYGLG